MIQYFNNNLLPGLSQSKTDQKNRKFLPLGNKSISCFVHMQQFIRNKQRRLEKMKRTFETNDQITKYIYESRLFVCVMG